MRTSSSRQLGPAFSNVFAANLGSSLADGIARTAAPLLATRLTDDPLLVSGVAVASLLPWLLFAIPAGIVLDRVDRRRALAVANTLRALIGGALVALTATNTLTIWSLLAVVLLYGVFETVYDGAIRAVLPSIVDRKDLPRANGRIEGGEVVVQQFLSAPLTSWLFAIAVVVPLTLGATAYAAAAALALFLPVAAAGAHARRALPTSAPAVERDREPWLRQLLAGYRFVRGHQILWPLWVLSVSIALCFATAISTYVLFVLDELGVPESWYGTYLLVGAVGSLVGSVVAGRLQERFGSGHVMAAANLAGLVSLAVAGALPHIVVAAVCMFVSFACTTLWNVNVMSLRQALIPDGLLGRVHGTWRTLLWGAMPLGSLVGGLLARVGLGVPLVVGGAAGTVLAIVGYRFLTRLPDPADV